jgi:CheY-like chemotaxis protein
VGLCDAGSSLNLTDVRFRLAVADVIGDCVGEKEGFLKDKADLTADGIELGVADVDAVDEDFPFLRVVEASEELDKRAFAGTGRANQRDDAPGGDVKRNIMHNRPRRVIAKGDKVKLRGTATLRTTRRLLLIEDHPDMAATLRDLLELAGYTVEVARSGAEGIACARQFPPELVICDIGLPGMDGYEVARALRQEPSTAGAHLIALSGYAQEEDLQRSREAGFDWHLKKPVEFNELVRVLQRTPSPDRCLAGS